jgi:hypothetical protein
MALPLKTERMKRFTLTFAILCAFCALAYTGERYSGKDKEIMQPAPPSCDWYRAHEWDLNLWGSYAIPANNNDHRFRFGPFVSSTTAGVGLDRSSNFREPENVVDRQIGDKGVDHLINREGAWGGGADLKYFFSKYWGLGVEGFVLDANDNIAGAGLGTFTFRYPIGCSRFAPYAFAGFGAISGGSHTVGLFTDKHTATEDTEGEEEETERINDKTIQNKHTLAIGQFGAGLEVRITRPTERSKIAVGFMADFAWNVVQERDNDFGMGRFGLTFSY